MTKVEENIKLQIEKYQSFENKLPQHRNGQIKLLEILFKNIDKNLSILDVGCGDGVGLRWFIENNYLNVEGFDANPNKLKFCADLNLILYEGDMHKMCSIIHKKFDIIYCSHALEHAVYPNIVIENFKQLLNDKGKMFIVVPYPDNGPSDAHCGKEYLKTRKISNRNIDVIHVFNSHGLKVISTEIDNIREPEIRIILEK